MSDQSELASFQTEADASDDSWREMVFSEAIGINNYPSADKGEIYPHVGMKQVPENERQVKEIIEKEYSYSKPRFRNGDTLFAKITPCLENGKTAFVDVLEEGEVATGSTEFIVMSATDYTLPKFVYYTARRPDIRQFAIKRMTGTSGRQRVPIDIFDNKKIRIPSIEEQKKIVKVLDSFDSKIELNSQIDYLLEEIGQTIFKSWFVDFDHHSKAQNTELGEVPEHFEIKTIGEIAELTRGLSYSSDYMDENGFALVNLNNIAEGGGFQPDGTKYYSGDHQDRHQIEPGDVVIAITEQTMDGELIGSPASIPPLPEMEKMIISQDTCAVRPHEDCYITRQFLYHLFRTDRFRQYAEGHASGTTVYHLNPDSVSDYKFVLPPEQEVVEFSNIIENFWKCRFNNLHENFYLEEIRDLLLPRLMSGEIRVSDINVEEEQVASGG